MPKFRKKPIVIEAEQWFPGNEIEGIKRHWVNIAGHQVEGATMGIMEVKPGDWIITEFNGEKHLCKPDIFLKTYELVEE